MKMIKSNPQVSNVEKMKAQFNQELKELLENGDKIPDGLSEIDKVVYEIKYKIAIFKKQHGLL
jgi:hypothetical protein